MAIAKGYEFKTHANAEARKRSAVGLIKLLLQKSEGILQEHRDECINVALWKLTQAESTHKHRTRFCSEAAQTAPEEDLRHDHVFQRGVMVKALIKCSPDEVDQILANAVACTITHDEHIAINKHKNLDGWERYRAADIKVLDMKRTTDATHYKLILIDEIPKGLDSNEHGGTDYGDREVKISNSQAYIKSNPRFSLARSSRSKISAGQMAIVYSCLKPVESVHSLEELVKECEERDYRSTFRNPKTDIRKSILYQLNLLAKSDLVKEIN